MNIGLINVYSVFYGVCLFTVTVRYSVGQFVIQIAKLMIIGLIHLYSILFGVCLFTFTVVIHFPSSFFKSKNNLYCTYIFIQDYLWSLSIHSYSSLFSWLIRYSNRQGNEYRTNQII